MTQNNETNPSLDAQEARHKYLPSELNRFKRLPAVELKALVEAHLAADEFGKALPLFEIYVAKLSPSDESFFETRFRLAVLYSVLGESRASLPLWEAVLKEARRSHAEALTEVLFQFGSAAGEGGDLEKAHALLNEGHALAVASNDSEMEEAINEELRRFELGTAT